MQEYSLRPDVYDKTQSGSARGSVVDNTRKPIGRYVLGDRLLIYLFDPKSIKHVAAAFPESRLVIPLSRSRK